MNLRTKLKRLNWTVLAFRIATLGFVGHYLYQMYRVWEKPGPLDSTALLLTILPLLPWGLNCYLWFFRSRLFRRPPLEETEEWQQFVQLCERAGLPPPDPARYPRIAAQVERDAQRHPHTQFEPD